MTQPIQEPSTQRSVSGLAWGESQLARRPGPPPPSSVFLPWGYRDNAAQAPQTATDGLSPIVFPVVANTTHWDVSDLADIEPVDDSGIYGDVFGLNPLRHGFWRFRITAYFLDADPSIPYAYIILSDVDGELVTAYIGETYGGNNYKSFEAIVNPSVYNTPVYPFFYQNSGVDKQFTGAVLNAVYLGDFTGAATYIL